MRFDLLTIFPEIFKSYLGESIIKRAVESGKIEIFVHDIRKFSLERHKKVDDTPYGGGAGMLMTPQPVYDCVQHVKKLNNGPVIYLSPKGDLLTQNRAIELYKEICKKSDGITKKSAVKKKAVIKKSSAGLILLCGRYEGIDQRAIDLVVDKEISIGKYVLTGGELPAMVLIDVISRLIPGVLGDTGSAEEETFSRVLNGKKEYPHYTRPEVFMGKKVPDVLISGHHANIKKWRMKNLK